MIAADTDYVRRVYKLNNVLGNYNGELSNPGELLRLEDAHGNLADEVEYSNHGNWPGWTRVVAVAWNWSTRGRTTVYHRPGATAMKQPKAVFANTQPPGGGGS